MTQEVEKISTLTKRKLTSLLFVSILLSVTAAAQLDVNSGYSSYKSDYFVLPEYGSQQEIATELVAPFIFISVLLHFALSRALSFILASGKDEDELWDNNLVMGAAPWAIRVDEDKGPNTSKYAMIMSITITASLIPTPYWSIITGLMASIGTLTVAALTVLFLYGFYNVAKALA